jgi:membrane-associated protease RseP (regulator of RpoE activity)
MAEHGQEVLTATFSPRDRREWILSVVLFLATFASTTFAGLFFVYGDVGFLRMALEVIANPSTLRNGTAFSFTLITILLAHEMGHYLACRHYGIRCTPPYFIPFPFSFAGTMGAFIRIKAPFHNRKSLFDVGIAGPLAGFAVALPALVIGVGRSRLIPKGSLIGGDLAFGEPLLFRWVGSVVLGYAADRQDMIADPMAMAAWFGLLVTSLNLFPIWQLDGGHIAYALCGRENQKRITIGATAALVLISFLGWPIPSYLVFAVLLLILGLRSRFYHPPTMYEDEKPGFGRVMLGILALWILLVTFIPVPIYLT